MTTSVTLSWLMLVLLMLSIPPMCDGQSLHYLALVLDVSGSMAHHGFEEAKRQLMHYLRSLPDGSYFWIIPFAENDMAAYQGAMTSTSRAATLGEAASFIQNLKTGGGKGTSYGHYTHLDEGVDAGKLAVLEASGAGRRSVVLVTDGISDPGPNHQQVLVQDLARRMPETIQLYLLDIGNQANHHFPPAWKHSFGNVVGYQVPQRPVAVVPTSADRLNQSLKQLPLLEASGLKNQLGPSQNLTGPSVTDKKPWHSVLRSRTPSLGALGSRLRDIPWRPIMPYVLAGLVLLLALVLLVTAVRRIKRRREQTERLRQERTAMMRQRMPQEDSRTLSLSVAETSRQEQYRLSPLTSVTFGTQEGVDMLLRDASRTHIQGRIYMDENHDQFLLNEASTFPFTVDGQTQVPRGGRCQLPEQVTIQVSRDLTLQVSTEWVPQTGTGQSSINDLIRKYRPEAAS